MQCTCTFNVTTNMFLQFSAELLHTAKHAGTVWGYILLALLLQLPSCLLMLLTLLW